MKDKEFLFWLHERLHCNHPAHVPLNTDDLDKLKAIIDRTPDDQDTRIGVEVSIEAEIASFRKKYEAGGLLDIVEAVNKRMDQMAVDISIIKATLQRL